jgi:hypothetical protein
MSPEIVPSGTALQAALGTIGTGWPATISAPVNSGQCAQIACLFCGTSRRSAKRVRRYQGAQLALYTRQRILGVSLYTKTKTERHKRKNRFRGGAHILALRRRTLICASRQSPVSPSWCFDVTGVRGRLFRLQHAGVPASYHVDTGLTTILATQDAF